MEENLQDKNRQPLCFSDRKTWKKTDRYMFISYAHKDADTVYADLSVLYNNCLNYWYDKKLSVGDEWDKTVEDMIRNPQCAGIILYFSADMVKSAACEKELRIYREIEDSGRKDFKLFPVSVNSSTVNATVRDAYISCADMTAQQLDAALPAERVENVLKNIKSSVFYLNRTDNGFHLTKLIEELKNYDENLFCSDDVALDKLSRLPIASKENGISFIRLGSFPQQKASGEFVIQDGVKQTAEGLATIKNGNGFIHGPLRWIILKNDNIRAVAIAEYVLDKCNGADLQGYFESFIKNAVDDDDIRSCIEEAGLPDIESLKEFDNVITANVETDYCKSYRKSSFWPMFWGKLDGKVTAYFKKYSPMTVNVGSNVMCGIRPCITINIDKLLEKYTR